MLIGSQHQEVSWWHLGGRQLGGMAKSLGGGARMHLLAVTLDTLPNHSISLFLNLEGRDYRNISPTNLTH